MKSLDLPRVPDDAHELVELESSTAELLAELDKEMEQNRHLRELSSVALSVWDETDREADASLAENKSDTVQNPPK